MSSLCLKNKQILKLVKPISLANQNRNLLLFNKSNKKILIIDLNWLKNIRFNSSKHSKVFSSFSNGFKYFFAIGIGTSAGLLTGYWFILDQSQSLRDENEDVRSLKLLQNFQPTRFIENKDSSYNDFPLTIHLYQYEACPYCSQIRAYLDYFGFSYNLTEVDTYNKEELSKFTKAKHLPIIVLEDKLTKKRWNLANSTAILSALESVRNNKHINFKHILNQYLPVLKGNTVNTTINPFKYHVSDSDLNDVEWRKWINNNAIPIFKLNSIDNLKDLFERFDIIAEKSGWKFRYNHFKYLYVYYTDAFKSYRKYSAVLKHLDSIDRSKKPRDALNDVITKWENGLGDNHFISGKDKPNLADISMFGNVRAYEGCALFREAIAKHPKFRIWYEKMKLALLKGYQRLDKKNIAFFLDSLDENLEEKFVPENKETKSDQEIDLKKQPKEDSVAQTDIKNEKNLANRPKSQITLFRILTVNYLVHVIAFTYAAWMAK